MATRSRFLLLLVGALLLSGCGSAPVVLVTSPFTASDSTVFDQGVDFVADPDILEGHWAEDWTRDLHHRMGRADIVEVVHIISLHVNTQPDQDPTYRIDIAPDSAIIGEARDVDLQATTGDSGYSSIGSNQAQLLSGSFVLFVKWSRTADGATVAKWHMSPANPKIKGLVQQLADQRQAAPAGDGTTTSTTSTNN